MLHCILVEPGGIGFEQGSRVCGQRVIMAIRCSARIEQVIDKIHLCAVLTGNRAIPATRHGNHVLQGKEIVLCMSDGHAVSDIGVSLAVNVRHAEFAADDLCLVGPARVGCGKFLCGKRFPDHQSNQDCKYQNQHRPAGVRHPSCHAFSPVERRSAK